MISLSKLIDEHTDKIGYDLLTLTGRSIEEIGGSLSWRSFYSFVRNLDYKTETVQAINPEAKEIAFWDSSLKTNLILADIYDLLAVINSNLVAVGSRSRSKKTKPYPRPKQLEKNNTDVKHIGDGALPPDELRKWFEERRSKNGRDD